MPGSNARGLRNLIGVQLQSAGLPESITPDEAMKLFCAYHGAKPRFDLLERLGLAEKRSAQFFELSTGQQRRLSLALAIAHNPPVLILDEPTAGLDEADRLGAARAGRVARDDARAQGERRHDHAGDP